MGSRRRPLGRSYSGNGRFSAYSLSGAGSDGEDNGPLVESRPERRSYLLSVRPENSLPTNRLSPSNFGRSTFCTIIAQLTEETQPLFETTLKSYAVSEDASAKFTCVVTGYPQPEVTWYKDDEEMDRYCGLPKYEIFRHGNRHTLQLYNCKEDDAAIYQASARNSKGIVSCSGVLEVGTMTEYKIHQRWFAKLKRKAEAKLREIEQSRKRGKENVEAEQLRRVSPDRFQRKRRLTGEVGMRSGASLWDKEEVAKVHIPDPKQRLNEDSHAKSKESPLDAKALFSNNFITGRLEADVTTNGDSSLSSAEENGEANGNGFLTYIYETVEIMTSKPTNREFAAKKKKKEENALDLPSTKQDISEREDRTQVRRTVATPKNTVPARTPEHPPSAMTNGELMETEPRGVPSQITGSPAHLHSHANVYFSLKDMYFDVGAKLETEQEGPEKNVGGTDVYQPTVDVSSAEETVPVWTRTVPEEGSTEQEAKGKDALETSVTEAAKDFNVELTQYPKWTTESTPEVEHAVHVPQIPGKTASETELQPPSWVSEAGLSKGDGGETFEDNIRETDLLDSLPTDVPQAQVAVGPHVDSPSWEAAGDLPWASSEEQLPSKGPCEAPENLKPTCFTTYDAPQPPASGFIQETNQKADYLSLKEDSPVELETKWLKKRSIPSPKIQEPSIVVVSQEGSQYSRGTSLNPPSVSLDLAQPTGEEPPLLEEEVEKVSPVFGSDENQHTLSPDRGREEMGTAGFSPQRADLETSPIRGLDRGAPQTEAAIRVKQEEAFESLRGNRPDLKMDLGLEVERTVTTRPLLIPEAAVELPVPYQSVPDKPPPSPTVATPLVFHGSQGPSPLSPIEGDLAERNQSVASLLRDVKRDMDPWQPARPPLSEPAQQADGLAGEVDHAKEVISVPQSGGEDEQESLTLGQKLEVSAAEEKRTASSTSLLQDLSQPETAMEEDDSPEKKQQKNLVSSLKNYLLLLLKMTSEADKSKESPKQEAKVVEERAPPTALPRHVKDVGIAGLTPRTSRKIFERVETNQLFQSAECLQLTPKSSRRLTGMINQELLACQERLMTESKVPPLPCVPSIVVGNAPGEPTGLPDLPLEVPSEAPAALPSATPQELALGARRKIFLPKTKQGDEMEGVVPDGQAHAKKDSPTVSPQQSRRNAALLQTPVPSPSPPVERRSPTLARKMATLEVPKIYEETTEESKDVADSVPGVPEKCEEAVPEGQTGESRRANDPFKAPQVIRKIRAEQFSDASGNLKLWCQFFNVLSDSKLTWYKDEIPVTETRRSSGDEGQAALAIVQVSLKDCGVYQCTIQNEYGTDSTDFLQLRPLLLSGFLSKEEIEAGEEIEMTPMVFAKGLADSGFWGDKFFGRIMVEDLEVGQGFLRKACRARAIYGLEPVFESGHTGIIKIRNLVAFGGRSENTLMERNYDITIQECKIQNSSREYCKIFAAEARAIPAFGPAPEIIPVYLIYRPANNIPYATMEEDLPGLFERFCGRERDGSLAPASTSEVGHKCATFQHWLYQWTNGNILVTDLEGVGWKVTNVRIATKTKGYQGLKDSYCPALLEHFTTSHRCNRYCELLALKSLETPQPPPRAKGSRSPISGRKASSAQSSPQLQKKGLSSPQTPRKGSVSPKSARKSPEVAELQPPARAKAGDSGKAGRLQ
ncbi:PREDICTED: alpha-protein kinase 3 [Gekko japonicus]|uniref:non-specific serine/threonine protein kinase n=1 Tax=Gekko japonicus TaxID=146911 RepID=A0ABM1JLQ0_GEKJA|nr:PREDICTED: alpha-protein kinase 3 [Gekko japonicus]